MHCPILVLAGGYTVSSGATPPATRDSLSPGSIQPQPPDKGDNDAAGVVRRCRRRAPLERGYHRVRRDGGDAHDPLLQLHGGRRVAPTYVPSVRIVCGWVCTGRARDRLDRFCLFRPLMGTCVCVTCDRHRSFKSRIATAAADRRLFSAANGTTERREWSEGLRSRVSSGR